MENAELLRRMEDLSRRCEKTAAVTQSPFLSPAEQFAVSAWSRHCDSRLVLFGGHPDCERKAAFFLPSYLEDEPPLEGYISVLRLKAGFGEPSHRDCLGALMGLGIVRDRIGDIWTEGSELTLFCLPSVEGHIMGSLDRVGRLGVRISKISPDGLIAPERRVKHISFSVKSPRLDAVCAAMFGISRSQAAERISAGLVSLNYSECLKCDALIREGDIISLRGAGKGIVGAEGGLSRKGRLFMNAELLK